MSAFFDPSNPSSWGRGAPDMKGGGTVEPDTQGHRDPTDPFNDDNQPIAPAPGSGLTPDEIAQRIRDAKAKRGRTIPWWVLLAIAYGVSKA